MKNNDSSNRILGVLRVMLEVKRSFIDGKGLFAISVINAKQKIGDLGGEIVDQSEGRKRANGKRRIAIVELHNGKAIDASRWANELRYINHSCSPNTFMRIFVTE